MMQIEAETHPTFRIRSKIHTMNYSQLPTDPMDAYPLYSPGSEAYLSPNTSDSYFAESYPKTAGGYFPECSIDGEFYGYPTTKSFDIVSPWGSPSPGTFASTNPLVDATQTPNCPNLNAWSGFSGSAPAYSDAPYGAYTAATSRSSSSNPSTSSTPASPALSPRKSKHTRMSPPSNHQTVFNHTHLEPPKRKRGRPRLPPPTEAPINPSTSRVSRSQCVPHTEVERRYREKLNTELDRLRRAVPCLLSNDAANTGGAARISKSVVLAVAIDYIKELEKQRDMAVDEVRRLGGDVPFGG